jgi:hypothetical protein
VYPAFSLENLNVDTTSKMNIRWEGSTVHSESRCALRLQYIDLVVSIKACLMS